MSDGDLQRNLRLALALIILPLLTLIALETYQVVRNGPRLRESRVMVTHTFEVITTAQALDRSMQDAERGQRGYLITGDIGYLEPYASGVRKAPALLAKLKTLTAENAEQQEILARLDPQISLKFTEMQGTIDARRQLGFEAARKIVANDVGLTAMREITRAIDAIIAHENVLLSDRLALADEEERHGAYAALAGDLLAAASMLLGIALVLLAFRRIRSSDTAKERHEERFRLLVDGVTDYAIYMLDPQGRITDWNKGAERLKGYTAEEIVGQYFSQFYTPEDLELDLPGRALDTAARTGRFEAEGWRVRKDGSRFLANVLVNPLRDQSGNLIGFAKITRNVTERHQQQQVLEQTREALAQSQKMDALGQLSGGIAHDFNNLLGVIKNRIEILQRRLVNVDPELKQFFEMMRRSADRAASLTQRMLAFSRRQPLAPASIDFNKLIAGMEGLLRQALGESVALEVVLASGMWRVNADENQLEAAILNLAVNARDAMPGGGRLTIETGNTYLDESYAAANSEVTPGQYGMVAVSDTGAGMTRDIVAKAFEPFFSTKEPGKGTGLGLSQVYGFIKQSGGHVKIYSEPGEGTTVKLYLPRTSAPEAAYTVSDAVPHVHGQAGGTILLVEDDKDLCESTAEQLRALGYRVLPAPDARFALEVLDKEPQIDLLLTDVGLPHGINGRQLADEARRRRPQLKVLFTTGYARNAIVHHGRLDAGVDLLLKPFTQSALGDKVRQVLERPVAVEKPDRT
jgi:PAS domain S-box-containing protein